MSYIGQVSARAMQSADIGDNAVITAKIADDDVTQAKVANDAIGPDELASNAVVSASIVDGAILNADVNASAAIVDTKLATIATANKVGLAALDIDGGTEIGANIVDADLFIIDDGAGGTNRKVLASRIATYAAASAASESFAIAMAVAL